MNRLPVLSLNRRGADLANPLRQQQILETENELPRFQQRLTDAGLPPLVADGIRILQVNVGKRCNMTCRHCHVDAGPDRRENMDRETIDWCLSAIRTGGIETLDLTGGAPEMNPNFRYFVERARDAGCHVIDRCNLTILLANGYQDLPEFLAAHEVEVVASLPCYLAENVEAQRGDGSFQKSILALRRLNDLGYGNGDPRLKLTLVYNPVGPVLPPDQRGLEQAYHQHLAKHYDVHFDRLFTITNMPISRFLDDLLEQGHYEDYMTRLAEAFNPAAVSGVMCRQILSVGWDGRLFDCDFNQMLDLPVQKGHPQHIRDFILERLERREIVTGRHCFGCTASCGSGCLGAIVDAEA